VEPVVGDSLDLCCSAECHTRLLFATDPSALRAALFQQDRGVCALCSLDCAALLARLKPLVSARAPVATRRAILLAASPRFAEPRHEARLARLAESSKLVDGDLWQADHTAPVSLGGGLCGLENMRTLCTLCHVDVSAQLARVQAERRAALKETEFGGKRGKAKRVECPEEEAAAAAEREEWLEIGDEDFRGRKGRRQKAQG
jgi:5-methylcytosine-specific restriction endonuclease McrA